MAKVNFDTRSRRVAGTKRRPKLVACGNPIMKYRVRISTVIPVNAPERTVFPTPITPPKAEIIRVPSDVTSANLV